MDEAQSAIKRHADAINARDLDVYRETISFPFTYQNDNGVALTIDKASDCGETAPLPWDIILQTDPHWSHTEFDALEEVARSVSSVVYKFGFRRIDVSGQASDAYDAIWIATCQQGRWGVQFRHNLGQRAKG